jgi:DNA (cytosine-5)-methyltransferase 1
MSAKPTALGVYIFAGGFSLGVRESFKVLAHLEQWPFGAETARRNLQLPVYESFDAWEAPLEMMTRDPRQHKVPLRNGVDFVFANPPCAPWSTASHGRATHWSEDPRLSCFWRTFDVFKRVRPRVLAIESVAAMYGKAPDLIAALARKAAPLGYHATVLRVNAQNHGVAQTRRRVFVMLHDVALTFTPPRLDPIPAGVILKTVRGKTAYKEARIAPANVDLVRRLPAGTSLRKLWDAEHPRLTTRTLPSGRKIIVGRPSFMDRRIDPTEPCGTMTGSIKHFHPTKNRFITIEEAAALCGFPPWYTFKPSEAAAEIAKGVMPPVGAYLGREVARSIRRNARLGAPPTAMIPVEVVTVDRAAVSIETVTAAYLEEKTHA